MTTETTETPEVPTTPPEAAPLPPEPQSLMEPLPTTTTQNVNTGLVNAPSTDSAEPSPWYLAEGVVGQGDKPEYLQDKFTSVATQAKAYAELETRMGAHKGAPAEYDLKFIEKSGVTMDPNQPHLQNFLKGAKELHGNQEIVELAVNCFLDYSKTLIPNPEKELADLGEEGIENLNTMRQWAINTLPPDEAAAICYASTSAPYVRAVTKWRHSSQPSVVPTDSKMVPVQQQVGTVGQLRQEMTDNYEKYCGNPTYRKDHDKRMAVAVNREDARK